MSALQNESVLCCVAYSEYPVCTSVCVHLCIMCVKSINSCYFDKV